MGEPVSRASAPGVRDARRFRVAWAFLLASAVLGALLRLHFVVPLPWLNYGYVLHAHSHVAFLGWVFNAFFIAALRHFVPIGAHVGHDRLWRLLQIAVVGMLIAFPLQGYGPAGILFSTLHMGAAAVFAWKLGRNNHACAAARPHLVAALVFMVISGLGPLALGPLAALDLRDSPAYPLAIYHYLHFQYNGWFMFFLQALWIQRLADAGRPVCARASRRALYVLATGCVLTVALSALWCAPWPWVRAAAAIGGLAQLVGCVLLVRTLPGLPDGAHHAARFLAWVAVVAFLAKHALQALAALPALDALAMHRFTVIAFLHLVFLGVATPALLAHALSTGWIRQGPREIVGLALFLAGAAATGATLAAPLLAGTLGLTLSIPLHPILLGAALAMTLGIALTAPRIGGLGTAHASVHR